MIGVGEVGFQITDFRLQITNPAGAGIASREVSPKSVSFWEAIPDSRSQISSFRIDYLGGAMYREFEELPVYQAGMEFCDQIYTLSETARVRRDFAFLDQIRRAATSITNNIAEGYERDSKKEFRYLLRVAKGSAGEVRSMLHLARRLQYISDTEHKDFVERAKSISRQIAGFIRYLDTCAL